MAAGAIQHLQTPVAHEQWNFLAVWHGDIEVGENEMSGERSVAGPSAGLPPHHGMPHTGYPNLRPQRRPCHRRCRMHSAARRS
jgi:hypothetical protein